MYNTKKAFSFVEIIITISIIALLTVIGISSKNNYDNNINNAKVVSNVETINNALTSFSEETKTLPMPMGNTNFYGIDTGYMHSYDDPDTFGVYGSITEDTLSKKYLEVLPLDPRTNAYYSYGKTKASNEFEIASIQYINNEPRAKVIGNYSNNLGPLNLIRQYNGSNFVYDGSTNSFPYNPEELVLIVTTATGAIYREGDTITATDSDLEIFFSDGSVSVLEMGTTITLNELNFEGKNNLSTIVKIGLGAGKIWTRATSLNDTSEFEVYTQDSAAAVRGTIFAVGYNTGTTEVTVIEGEVDVYKNVSDTYDLDTFDGELIKSTQPIGELTVAKGEEPKTATIDNGDMTTSNNDSTTPEFSSNLDSREIEVICENSFIYDGKCIDNDLGEEWKVFAYAPYNEIGDLNMYTKDDNITTESGAINHEGAQWNTGELDMDYSFTQTGGIKGVYIDQDGNNDFIKYSGLDLSGDFAIEMNLRGFNRSNGPYNIFNMEGLNVELNTGKLYVNENFYTVSSDTNFHKIIVKKESGIITTLMDGKEILTINADTSINDSSELLIGSKYLFGYINQWNDIIDYVKIYSR